jgi:Fe-Mn family superoxide dismutase
MPYLLKPLSCDPAKLTGLSEKLIVSHWENNYGGAVKRLNAIEQRLAELNWASAPVFEINGLKREEMIASGSMILHEVYFDSLGGTGRPRRALKAAIERDFGSVDAWRAEFTAMGKAQGGGSGWTCWCGARAEGVS